MFTQKDKSKQNLSTIGYKSFASQFQTVNHSNNNDLSQHKTFNLLTNILKKDDAKFFHSVVLSQPQIINQKNQMQMNLLHFAAFYNNPTVALYLLYKNIDQESLDKQGKSVFHISSYTGHLDTIKILIQFWKVMKIKTLNQNFIEILKKMNFKRTDSKLGKLKFQVSKQRQSKFNKGQQQIQKLYCQYRHQYTQFICKNYQLQQKDSSMNCFHFAALNKYQKCYITLEYMIKSFYKYDLQISNEIFMSINQVNPFVQNGIDPRQFEDSLVLIEDFLLPQIIKDITNSQNLIIKNRGKQMLQAKNKNAHTPLYLASKSGSSAIVALLKKIQTKYSSLEGQKTFNLDQIIKVALNNSSRNQLTDLCQASKASDVSTMNFLISCGQYINKKKTIFGTFALLQAVKGFEKHKNMQSIQVLIKSGADVNEQDINGWTIFHYIAEKGHKQILTYIFNVKDKNGLSKLKINKATNKGYHPLHIAAMNNRYEIIELMINQMNQKKYQIDINPLDQQKATILHQAAKKGSVQTLKKILILKGKQLINSKDVNQNTCLHLAAANNQNQCIKELIYYDSDDDNLLKVRNAKGKLAKDLTLNKKCFDNIFTAARQGNVNTIRNLISQNPKLLNHKTQVQKRTPLVLSVLNLQLVNVKFLIDSKADQLIQDIEGKKAKDYAIQLENSLQKDKNKLALVRKIKTLLQ